MIGRSARAGPADRGRAGVRGYNARTLNRFQKLAALTLATSLILVTIGVIVRATDSGLGCPDWPLCHGQLIPPLDDPKAWIEWVHRTVAVIIGFEILGLAVLAFVDHRDRRSILWPTMGAVALVGFQAWLGRETVRLGNSGESVTAHLAAAMTLVGLLVYLTVRASYPARLVIRGGSQRFTLLAAFGAAATFALLLFGSQVTATDTALVYPDWPLMGGTLFPPLAEPMATHVLHRWVAAVVGVIVATIAVVAWRTQRDHPTLVRLAFGAAVLFAIQIVVGGLQVMTRLAEWTQTLHLALGAIIWAMLAGLTVTSYYTARAAATDLPDGRRDPEATTAGAASSTGDTIRAYIALTKPRIIELLLVTTVPAMVLATRDLPGAAGGIDWFGWFGLVVWTMVGGTLAAGSANAINCYLDRDIDLLMTRTRRRPLPAHQVEPDKAVVFGIVLGVISVVLMAYFVNLVAAFLTLLAIAFYVVVYTLLLKRTTPQNIVIGGAAGALAAGHRLGRCDRQRQHPGRRAVPDRLLLDTATFLGALAPDPEGLRGCRRADAPGGQGDPRNDPPDRPVHRPDGGHLACAVCRRPDGPHLPGRRGRARSDVPVAGVRPLAARRLGGGLDRRRDPAVQVLDLVPDAAVRRGGRRRAGGDPGLAVADVGP